MLWFFSTRTWVVFSLDTVLFFNSSFYLCKDFFHGYLAGHYHGTLDIYEWHPSDFSFNKQGGQCRNPPRYLGLASRYGAERRREGTYRYWFEAKYLDVTWGPEMWKWREERAKNRMCLYVFFLFCCVCFFYLHSFHFFACFDLLLYFCFCFVSYCSWDWSERDDWLVVHESSPWRWDLWGPIRLISSRRATPGKAANSNMAGIFVQLLMAGVLAIYLSLDGFEKNLEIS